MAFRIVEPGVEPAEPVGQPCVMASNEVGQHAPCGAETGDGVQRAGGRMGGFASFSFDMGIRLKVVSAGLPDVVLETGPVFAEIVPLSGKTRPVCTIGRRMLSGQRGDTDKVSLQVMRLSPLSLRIPRRVRDGPNLLRLHDCI